MVNFWVSRRARTALIVLLLLIPLALLLRPNHVTDIWQARMLQTNQLMSPINHDDISPLVPSWNRTPAQHVPEVTPLFIGFTRNWPVLKQAVVSYIAAGWPPSDIYVVDNSGTMTSNALKKLSPENPFYLDHDYLTRVLRVNVLTTPTLLSFAQLQNFFLYTSITNYWPHYFWSHMDVAVLSSEIYKPFASLYIRAVDALREATTDSSWGIRFFAYDHLTLANTASYAAVGGFDTFIPYYTTDCDFHFRISQAGFTIKDLHAGLVHDVGESLPDLTLFTRENSSAASATCTEGDIAAAAEAGVTDTSADKLAYGRGDCRWHALRRLLSDLSQKKQSHKGGRNFWQLSQSGGRGEPFWVWPEGFERALSMHMEHGKQIFASKWAHPGCDLKKAGNSCRDSATCSAWKKDVAKDG